VYGGNVFGGSVNGGRVSGGEQIAGHGGGPMGAGTGPTMEGQAPGAYTTPKRLLHKSTPHTPTHVLLSNTHASATHTQVVSWQARANGGGSVTVVVVNGGGVVPQVVQMAVMEVSGAGAGNSA
jgi:hypothetical protein